MKKLCPCIVMVCLSIVSLPLLAKAQDEARASWQVAAFDIAANVQQSERALNALATLTLNNVGRGAGSALTLRINSKAKVNSVKVNGADASFHVLADTRGNVQRLNITFPTPLAGNS